MTPQLSAEPPVMGGGKLFPMASRSAGMMELPPVPTSWTVAHRITPQVKSTYRHAHTNS